MKLYIPSSPITLHHIILRNPLSHITLGHETWFNIHNSYIVQNFNMKWFSFGFLCFMNPANSLWFSKYEIISWSEQTSFLNIEGRKEQYWSLKLPVWMTIVEQMDMRHSIFLIRIWTWWACVAVSVVFYETMMVPSVFAISATY